MRPEELRQALGFQDIGILPVDKSDISSRKEVSTETKLSRNLRIKYPIIASPMDTISDIEMCLVLNSIGAAAILHRFMPIEEQVEKAERIKKETGVCYVAIGLHDYQKRVPALKFDAKVDLLYLDTANGSSPLVEEFMQWYREEFFVGFEFGDPDIVIGNTLTKSSVSRAINLGTDAVRHGIGIGSACLTSEMTGIQCPPVTALYYGWKAMRNYELTQQDYNDSIVRPALLLDGGIRKPGDLAKAIVCGADAAICGGIFAGCKETPGDVVDKEGVSFKDKYGTHWQTYAQGQMQYKKFRGMASKEVVEEYGLWDGNEENLFIEGKEELVPYTGKSAVEIVYQYVNGLRSAMSYLGFSSISEARGSLWTGDCLGVRL